MPQLVMNASPGCGLFMHQSESRGSSGPVRKLKVDDGTKVDTEELRVEKKLRLMLEKKVSALSAKLEKDTLAKTVAEEQVVALTAEVEGLRECATVLSDAQETAITLREEADELHQAKQEVERSLRKLEKENRELQSHIAKAEASEKERAARMAEVQKEWTSQIDSLVMKEAMLEREKEDLSAELETVKNEHQTLLQHAQKLVSQYEVESEARLDLEERLANIEDSKLEKSEAQKEISNQELQRSQRIENENNRLREKTKRQDEDLAQLRAQVQALTTNLSAVKKEDVKPRSGRQVKVDKVEKAETKAKQEVKREETGLPPDLRSRIGKQVRVDVTQEAKPREETKPREEALNASSRSNSIPRAGANTSRPTPTVARVPQPSGERASIPLVRNVAKGGVPPTKSKTPSSCAAEVKTKPPQRGIGILEEEPKGRRMSCEDQLEREMRAAMNDFDDSFD